MGKRKKNAGLISLDGALDLLKKETRLHSHYLVAPRKTRAHGEAAQSSNHARSESGKHPRNRGGS
jgi:hypothetical protein